MGSNSELLDRIASEYITLNHYKLFREIEESTLCETWLCHDPLDEKKKWKTLKVLKHGRPFEERGNLLVAEITSKQRLNQTSQDFSIHPPIAHFWQEGSDGRQLCLVMDVAGPSTATISHDDPEHLRSVSLQISKGVRYLHGLGICHGNLAPSNIYFQISEDIHNISESEMFQLLETAQNNDQLTESSYEEVGWPKCLQHLVEKDKVCISGFDISFQECTPWADAPTTPTYASPELLKGDFGYGRDIWALACTITEIRSGQRLFDSSCKDISVTLAQYESFLGTLPPAYQDIDTRKALAMDGKQQSPCRTGPSTTASQNSLLNHSTELSAQAMYPSPIHAAIAQNIYTLGASLSDDSPNQMKVRYRLSRAEVLILGDLLCRIFKYDSAERLTIDEIVNHSWFTSKFRRSSEIVFEDIELVIDTIPEDNVHGLRKRHRRDSSPNATVVKLQSRGRQRSQVQKQSPSCLDSKAGLMNTKAGGFIVGLAMATVFWALLILAKLRTVTRQLPWSPDTVLAEYIARSALSVGLEGFGSDYFQQIQPDIS